MLERNCKEFKTLLLETAKDILNKSNKIKEKNNEIISIPHLAIIKANDVESSKVYINSKMKECEKNGFDSSLYEFEKNCKTEDVIKQIKKLNEDDNITAIIVQLPLFNHLNKSVILEQISDEKDIDCFNSKSISSLYNGNSLIEPCTPAGIIKYLNFISTENDFFSGKNIVVIGKGDTIGKPISIMLMNLGATVTNCNSKTKNLKKHTLQADIIISAAGKEKLITGDMVKKDSIVIDVGINRNASGKLCGDVDYEKVSKKAKLVTPVPGGVGQLTIGTLMLNLVSLYVSKKAKKNED